MTTPTKGRSDYLKLGDWNTVCFMCGFKRKASMLVRHWQGYYVCPEHNEPRQPQDFVRGVPDTQQPPWTQPVPAPVYTYVDTYLGMSDGQQVSYQLGDGLYATTVTQVRVNNSIIPAPGVWTTNGFGLITFVAAYGVGAQIRASGSEQLPPQ